jgi:uncharacterized membrane protein YphA (DoxX/SURF4 family)
MARELWTPSMARVLVGAVLIAAGGAKVLTPVLTASILASRGIPHALAIGVCFAALEVLGGLALIMEVRTRLVALGLIGLVLLASILLHMPIVLAGPRALELAFDIFVIGSLIWVLGSTTHGKPKPA